MMVDHEDCTSQCRSIAHGDELAAVIQCKEFSDLEVAAYMTWKCLNYPTLMDKGGRLLAHVAASSGRLDLLRHFLQRYDCLNRSDEESGYSLLHASLYHGQVHCAVRLMQLGANALQVDNDHLTPLDIVMKDLNWKKQRRKKQAITNDWEPYLWGMNANYNVGCGHNRERGLPEPQERFRKNGIHIVQVALQKFHSVFVSATGSVWSCGHGPGGRLGQGSENSSLEPKELIKPESIDCVAAAVGDDHTVLLMRSGQVMTFGLNTHHQLGHSPAPALLMSPKILRSLSGILCIAASQYHSVFCTEKQMYSCGLNAGQLGHDLLPNGGSTTVLPREATAFTLKKAKIICSSACPAATVVLSDLGAVFLFYNYRCTRLTPRDMLVQNAKKVCVTGGNLDPKISPVGSESSEIKVGLLAGDVLMLWRSTSEKIVQCIYSVKRELRLTDVAFFTTGCIFSTTDGEAFHGFFKDSKKEKPVEIIEVRRLPHVHRAEAVAADPRGRNFAVLQLSPLVNFGEEIIFTNKRGINEDFGALLDEAHEEDDIHDIVFQVEGRRFAAHSYIVFHSREMTAMKKIADELKKEKIIKLVDVPVEHFERALKFIYTGEIETFPNRSSEPQSEAVIEYEAENAREVSAFETYQKKKEKVNAKNEGLRGGGIRYVARKLGIAGLNEKIPTQGHKYLERKTGEFDATLKSLDGTVIHVHKCVLIARLDYFRVMLTHGWRESAQVELRVPVNGRVLEVLVDYMYTDESRDLDSCEDVDFLATVLIAADELLCEGLRLTVERKLVKLLNLRNAVDFLQLAITYNATAVQDYAQRFIVGHLTTFLEARSLEVLSDETLMELCSLYRENLSPYRRLRSSLDELEIVTIKSVTEAFPVVLNLDGDLAKPLRPSPRKKEKRERRTSERQRLISVDSCEEVVISPPPPPVAPAVAKVAVKREDTGGWVEVEQSKSSKVVQARLKAIAESKQMEIPPPQFTSLTRKEFVTQDTSPEKPKEVSLEKDFPQLNRQRVDRSIIESTPTKSSSSDAPKKFTKLSQKERRRQASQPVMVEEVVSPPKSPWGVIPPPELPVDPQSPPSTIHFAAIIDSEQKERERTARMRNKPLALTQLEDRAIHDLMIFYNVAGATEEKITVTRLATGTVAPPVWVPGHR